jgi:hypothetical protein
MDERIPSVGEKFQLKNNLSELLKKGDVVTVKEVYGRSVLLDFIGEKEDGGELDLYWSEVEPIAKSESFSECPGCGQFALFKGSCEVCKGDRVNSPDHYNQGSIECIDYIREVLGPEGFIAYCQGNVQKYLHRWRDKDEPLEDLEKALVYLGWMVETYKEKSK